MTLQRGKKAAPIEVELGEIREIAREDLVLLNNPRPMRPLDALRDNHHRIARALASGIPNGQVAALCGISVNRVSSLKQDPAFNELVAHYRGIITAEWTEHADTVTEFLGSVRTKSLAMLEDKLCAASENNEFLPTRELVAMAELGLDRTGYGKQSKTFNVNADFASLLEDARRRSGRAKDVTPIGDSSTAGSIPATRSRGGIGILESSSPPLSPIADTQSRDPQSVLVLEHRPQPGPAPSSFRRRM